MRRSQRPPGGVALGLLQQIPAGFVDDGCSSAPDELFGFDFGYACRIHDWLYCTRAHAAGTMTAAHRAYADGMLGELVREALPWRWRWVGWIYRAAVHRYGGIDAFDSCGLEAGPLCRHGLAPPGWMRLERAGWRFTPPAGS